MSAAVWDDGTVDDGPVGLWTGGMEAHSESRYGRLIAALHAGAQIHTERGVEGSGGEDLKYIDIWERG